MTKYLTPDQLSITAQEHAGLIKLAAHLAKDPVKHVQNTVQNTDESIASTIWDGDGAYEAALPVGFNMSYQIRPLQEGGREDYHCGTVACIGGHLSLLLQGVDVLNPKVVMTVDQAQEAKIYVDEFDDSDQRGRTPMADLFFPYVTQDWDRITPQQAAQAIENFLTTGRPAWSSIVPDLSED